MLNKGKLLFWKSYLFGARQVLSITVEIVDFARQQNTELQGLDTLRLGPITPEW